MKATDFFLPDENNHFHRLSDYRGQWVLIYFYPKDDTPGCTKEACGFRDKINELKQHKADSPLSHKKFKEKHQLNFPLLSDEKKR